DHDAATKLALPALVIEDHTLLVDLDHAGSGMQRPGEPALPVPASAATLLRDEEAGHRVMVIVELAARCDRHQGDRQARNGRGAVCEDLLRHVRRRDVMQARRRHARMWAAG